MSKEKLIPALRFPEFSENWVNTSVSELFDILRGSIFSKADITENGTEQCIHYGELFSKYNEVISSIISRTNKIDGIRSKVGDILMPSSDVTPTGLAKASAIMVDNVLLGGDMNILRPKREINSIFLSYLLNHSKGQIIKLVSGTTVKHIYPSQIATCVVPVVNNKTEQQKIASCLSSLDEVITAHSQQLALLKEHKKGLLQNLFPQGDEKVPKLRFKEFEKDGEWKFPKLEEKMDIFRGASPRPQGDPKYYGGKIPRLMIEDVTRDGKYSIPKIDSLTEEGAAKSRLLEKGSVVLSCSGTRVGIPGILAVDACIHDGWLGFRNFNEVDTEFLYYHFCNLHEKIQGNALAGGVFNNLTTSILKEMRLGFPDQKEQQKIADCLSSLDVLITAQAEKIEQLQGHKKGLMQGLFPKIKE
ncbi:restriction endonuclease subunit S [Phnomibacter sp. MR]|uniref:restriction endonuclease subunit S n=1 Tax=Phnomibacter sp. MR TaxID=3042318 RepID=UPI003A7F6C0D